jgi:hypothetical protein
VRRAGRAGVLSASSPRPPASTRTALGGSGRPGLYRADDEVGGMPRAPGGRTLALLTRFRGA